jgi:cytosine/adenosine deaminase-related metal-dependent hydrolase
LLDGLGIEFRSVASLARSPFDVLQALAEAPRVLVIHGNYLDTPALDFLSRQSHMSLVYCPRTHAYFGHPRYPLVEAMAAGINVAMGTDSRASNPDLSLLREAQTIAAAFPEIRAEDVLRMATVNGARALGQENRSGVLLPGATTRFIAIRIPMSADSDPYAAVLSRESTIAQVLNGPSLDEIWTP